MSSTMNAYDFVATTLDGRPAPLADYRGRVLLIVNTASKCGFTPQYAGLESLHETFGPRGLTILGFPCNQFGAQEPGNAEEIASFCSLTYNVGFPMMAKIDVNGPHTHPLWAWLKHEKKGILGSEGVKWNFTKFLIDRDGEVISRFAPTVEPKALHSAIQAAL